MTARRRKPSAAARIRQFWMPIGLLGVLAVAAGAFAATWSGFDPKNVEVTGNRRVPTADVLRAAAIAPHVSIWLQNAHAMARRIESIPYIGAVWIHRIPPASVRIAVTEREPFAVVQSAPESAVVDRSLRVLEVATGDESLPVLILRPDLELRPGAFALTRDAVELRDACEAMAARQIAPRSIAFDRYGGLVVTLRDGLRLLIGQESDLGQKLTLVDAILAQVVRGQRRVAAIDVRAPAAPVIVYR
jgi:cell division protein FtsQ